MSHRTLLSGILLLAFICFFEPLLSAEDIGPTDLSRQITELQQGMSALRGVVNDLQKTVASQNLLIQTQASRLEVLEGQGVRPVSPSASLSLSAPSRDVKTASAFNPEIGVVGTVQSKLTQSTEDAEGNDAVALKELELNFASVVDPYSRLDAILSFNDNLEDQNVDIEEAYYTRWGLPLGLTGQAGKFRSKIGKANLMHAHQLDTANYPLVIRNFFGEEGLASSGFRLQDLIPNPWDLPLEVTGEILRGNNGTSFSGKSRRPIFNTHLKTFFETSEDTDLELGWTTMFGDENPPRIESVDDGTGTGTFVDTLVTPEKGQDRYGVKVFGADATWNWQLSEGRKIKFQNEFYFQNRTNQVFSNRNPWGFYSLLDYRFSPRFSAGIRYDYLQPLEALGQGSTVEISPYLTFWQSEFADFKLQYSRVIASGTGEKDDNAIYLTVDFMIGAHKHPVQ